MVNKVFLTLIAFLFLSLPMEAVDYKWKKKKGKMALVKKKKGEKTAVLTDFLYDASYTDSYWSFKKSDAAHVAYNFFRDKDVEEVFRVRRDGKVGLLDSYGIEILPCEYNKIGEEIYAKGNTLYEPRTSYFSVFKDGKWGIVRVDLTSYAKPKAVITTPCQYSSLDYAPNYYTFDTSKFLEGEKVENVADWGFVNGKYQKIRDKVVVKYYPNPNYFLFDRDKWRGMIATREILQNDDHWYKTNINKGYVLVSRSKDKKTYYGLLNVVNNEEVIPTNYNDLTFGHAYRIKRDHTNNGHYITHGSEHIYVCEKNDTALALYSNVPWRKHIYESNFKVDDVRIQADKRTLLLHITGNKHSEYLCLDNRLVIPHAIEGEFNTMLSDEIYVFKTMGKKYNSKHKVYPYGLYNAKLKKQILPNSYVKIVADATRSGWFSLTDTANVVYQAFMPVNRDTVIILKDKAELLDICHAEDYGHNNSLLQFGKDYGFYFGDTDLVLPCSYDSIRPSRQVLPALSEDFDGVYLTYKNSRTGLIAKNGVVAPPIFQTILVKDSLLEIKIDAIPEIWTLHAVRFDMKGYIRPTIMVTAQDGECSGQMNFTEIFRNIDSRRKWHAMLSLGAYMDNREMQGLATVYYALSNDLETRQGVEAAEKYLNVAKERYGYKEIDTYKEMVAEAKQVIEQREAKARQAAYEEQQRLAEERRRQRQEGLMQLSQTLGKLGQDIQNIANKRNSNRSTTYRNNTSTGHSSSRSTTSNNYRSSSSSGSSSPKYIKQSCSGGTPLEAKFKCGGSGKCYRCHGTGIYNPSLESPYSKVTKAKCPTCNATGICTRCGGKGYKMKRVR